MHVNRPTRPVVYCKHCMACTELAYRTDTLLIDQIWPDFQILITLVGWEVND